MAHLLKNEFYFYVFCFDLKSVRTRDWISNFFLMPLEKRRDSIQHKMEKYYFTNVLWHTSGDVCCAVYIYRVPLSSYFISLFALFAQWLNFSFTNSRAGMMYSRCSACYIDKCSMSETVYTQTVGDSIKLHSKAALYRKADHIFKKHSRFVLYRGFIIR